ncbi:MAG: hypothetical protein M1837_003493 [Sclerophora amabilis]|nr:MAG: hypothetical protein M1837_003493 [Sclerophora amabilis]
MTSSAPLHLRHLLLQPISRRTNSTLLPRATTMTSTLALARPSPSTLSATVSSMSSSRRAFRSSARLMETTPAAAAALPVRKPVGAFRGGFFGFLLGSTLAGAGVYYYILEEYRVSNELLTEDIYSLQAAVQRIHGFVSGLEERLDAIEKKKGGK